MGKRKGSEPEDVDEEFVMDSPSSSHKKHKKHKKKHKKKRDHDSSLVAAEFEGTPKPAIKLKLRIGGETLSTKNIVTPLAKKESSEDSEPIIDVLDDSWNSDKAEDKSEAGKKDGNKEKKALSDDEKEWLDALERGDLDDSGMLKKSKDKKLLTARQRALLHGSAEAELLQLPSGYKQVELTEEQELKRQQRATKRRMQAHEKREKDKKLTLDRLLKKQETKGKKKPKRNNVPTYRYTFNHTGALLSVPQGYPLPFTASKSVAPKPPVQCGVSGCHNSKKYSCSKTGIPLCSLACFKKNLAKHPNITMVAVT